jgi:hypothetical protein
MRRWLPASSKSGGSHVIMLSQPKALTGLILQAAGPPLVHAGS